MYYLLNFSNMMKNRKFISNYSSKTINIKFSGITLINIFKNKKTDKIMIVKVCPSSLRCSDNIMGDKCIILWVRYSWLIN